MDDALPVANACGLPSAGTFVQVPAACDHDGAIPRLAAAAHESGALFGVLFGALGPLSRPAARNASSTPGCGRRSHPGEK